MKKGGYKIIDFKGTALSGTAVELPGIYDQIVDDYDKPIMVSGVTISGKLQDDAYASVKVNDDSVSLTVYGGIITVTEDDEVSFVVSKTPAELTAEIGDLDDLETTEKDSLVDAINEVNNLTKYETETLTSVTGTLVATKYGRIVELAWSGGTVRTSQYDLVTLPNKFKPIKSFIFAGAAGVGGKVFYCPQIEGAVIKINPVDSETNFGTFHTTYISAE